MPFVKFLVTWFDLVVSQVSWQRIKKVFLFSSLIDETADFAVASYLLGGEIQTRDFVAPAVKENGPVKSYGFAEQRLQQVVETENLLDDSVVEQSNGSLHSTVNTVQDHLSASVEEPIGEPQKQTYASIVRTEPVTN